LLHGIFNKENNIAVFSGIENLINHRGKTMDKKGEVKMNYFSAIIAAIVAIIVFCIISVIFDIMPIDALPANFIGATLGALIGALITLVLLRGQTDIEEKKG
jgi:uncharacterized Tic20 family protein